MRKGVRGGGPWKRSRGRRGRAEKDRMMGKGEREEGKPRSNKLKERGEKIEGSNEGSRG